MAVMYVTLSIVTNGYHLRVGLYLSNRGRLGIHQEAEAPSLGLDILQRRQQDVPHRHDP